MRALLSCFLRKWPSSGHREPDLCEVIAQFVRSLTANQEVPGSIPGLLADLVSSRGFGLPYFRDIYIYKMLTIVSLFSFVGQIISLR